MSGANRLRALMARQLKPLSAMMNPTRPARMITYSIPTIRLKPTFKKIQHKAYRPACAMHLSAWGYAQAGADR